MAREDGWFKPGASGNPRGRPPGRSSARDAVKRALAKPAASNPDQTRLDVWAEELVVGANTTDDRLAILKWLEGGAPTQDAVNLERLTAAIDELEARIAGPGVEAMHSESA